VGFVSAVAEPMTPEWIVQQQPDAYSARDIEALLVIYPEDAQMFEHPSELLASGTAELRERFVARFREPNLRAILERVEKVFLTGTFRRFL
jgi:hypothetical protein